MRTLSHAAIAATALALLAVCINPSSAQTPPTTEPTPPLTSAPTSAPIPAGALVKTIELEWDAVENAGSYEVKLTPEASEQSKPLLFKTHDNHLTQQVPIGNYNLQVRAFSADASDASPWSEPMPFAVVVKELQPVFPADNATLDNHEMKKQPIEFRWTPVDKVKLYTLVVWSEDKKDKPYTFTTKETHKQIDVPPAQIYFWQVKFESQDDVAYQQQPKTFTFTILGKNLLKPEINDRIPPQPTELSWRPSPDAQEYSAKLYFHYLDEAEWQLVREEKLKVTHWAQDKLKPGAYKLEVQATAPRHSPSEIDRREFLVKPTQPDLTKALQQAQQ